MLAQLRTWWSTLNPSSTGAGSLQVNSEQNPDFERIRVELMVAESWRRWSNFNPSSAGIYSGRQNTYVRF